MARDRTKARCQVCASGGTHTPDFEHGTAHAYIYHACPCPTCREGWRQRRAENPAVRGYNKKQYYAHREEILQNRRDFAIEHPEVIQERSKHYYQDHKNYRQWQAADMMKRRKDIPCPRNREPWTPTEDAIVMLGDVSITEMCYLLGRSYQAVQNRRRKLHAQQKAA